ncbi:MAG: XdhC family protein, partial [Thermodesulfobacteriota bacterium]
TGDREEVFLIFHDPKAEYATLKKSAIVISQFTSDVVALMSPARARATVTGTVENAVSGAGLDAVTVTGYLPGSWEYEDGGGLKNVNWRDAERAFRVSTGDGGGYTASFTFPKKLPADAGPDADERIRLRLLFSRTGFETETDGDDDLSAPDTPADLNGDGDDDVYYESPLIIAGVDTAMNTISLKPTEFTVTVEGRVWRDDEDDEGTGSGDGELQKGDSGDTPTNGEEVVLTVTDPASGNTRTHRTTTERSFDLTHPITDTMDMICGGHMTVRLEFIEATPENREKFKQSLEESRRLHKTAFLFGAGHVSRQLAKLTQMVEFRTVVLDDRSEFANRDRFPGVDQVHVLDRFENTFSGLSTDSNSFIVILTRGHSHDRTVLAQALRTQAGYIGMIGSHRKRDTIYRSLRDEGFTTADLDRVHCPIGLDIGGETPEEIAVSIVAEMIEVRSGLK